MNKLRLPWGKRVGVFLEGFVLGIAASAVTATIYYGTLQVMILAAICIGGLLFVGVHVGVILAEGGK